jgi:hypothetical protein
MVSLIPQWAVMTAERGPAPEPEGVIRPDAIPNCHSPSWAQESKAVR